MPDDPPFVPDATLDLVAPGWWLELHCACGRTAQVPHRLLAERHGPRARVPDLLARLRCGTCRRPPLSAQWVDEIRGGPPQYPAPRRVPLDLPERSGPAAVT